MDRHRAKVATQETITILGAILVVICVVTTGFGLLWVLFHISPILGVCSLFVLFVALIWYACYN